MSREGDWGSKFPATLVEAVRRVKQARAAYNEIDFPEGIFPDTKPRTVFELIAERHFLNSHAPYALNEPDVPPGFEDWARRKIELASILREAQVGRNMYIERRMFGKLPLDVQERITTDPDKDEVYFISSGQFRIDIVDGRPAIKPNDYGALFSEAVEVARQRREDRARRLEDTPFSRIGWLPTVLEILGDLKYAVLNKQLIENVLLVHYFRIESDRIVRKNLAQST